MAFDEELARRMRVLLEGRPGLEEKRMFGGVGFLVFGNMACGVHKDGLIVRVGPGRSQEALAHTGTKPFDMTGKPMEGWVTVSRGGFDTEQSLRDWVEWGVAFAEGLPKKGT